MLHRFRSHTNDLDAMRILLGFEIDCKWHPRKLQMYVWQILVTLLQSGIILLLAGVAILLWRAARI